MFFMFYNCPLSMVDFASRVNNNQKKENTMRLTNPYGSSGDRVTLDQLHAIKTPEAKDRWKPIPHSTLTEMTRQKIREHDMNIVDEDHIVSRAGLRYFGMFFVDAGGGSERKVVGVRNAHDKSVAAGLCGGKQVIVCANMMFEGEIAVARKHTTNIMEGLDTRLSDALRKIRGMWADHDARMERYMSTEIQSQCHADSIVMEAFRRGGIKKTEIADVMELYRDPPHPEFVSVGNTPYNMLQAFTEAWKGSTNSLNELPSKSGVVTKLLDRYVDAPTRFNQPAMAGLGWQN